jgi:hypothetical protein
MWVIFSDDLTRLHGAASGFRKQEKVMERTQPAPIRKRHAGKWCDDCEDSAAYGEITLC